jgi:ubiquinone/menaquinone biosynthesis C-methylase UbiE
MHTLYFSKTMLQRGSVMVSTDISEEMIKMSKNRFEDPKNDYLAIQGNKAKITASELAPLGTKEWNLEKVLQEDLNFTENDRAVIAGIANNESLPFTDGTFDCYISSLSLMIVDNHLN